MSDKPESILLAMGNTDDEDALREAISLYKRCLRDAIHKLERAEDAMVVAPPDGGRRNKEIRERRLPFVARASVLALEAYHIVQDTQVSKYTPAWDRWQERMNEGFARMTEEILKRYEDIEATP